MDDIQFTDNPGQHRFEVSKGGDVAGYAEYNLLTGAILLTHTEVMPKFEGQGIGSKLAKGVLAEVRKRGLNVIPQCTFMAGYIRKHPAEYLDLVKAEHRKAYNL
jgi:predicted GNAT family acetyltransferase